MHVLIVDDNQTNLILLRKLVEKIEGCVPLAFADPLQALVAASTAAIDLVLVDYMMPGVDGISFVRRFRSFPSGEDVPIIMITTADERAILHAALEAGATDFLTKPIEAVEFLSRARNLLRLREAQNRLREQACSLAAEVAKATAALGAREEEIILRLSRAAEQRDDGTGDHILRMASLCRTIAEGLGLDRDTARTIYLAAPMHDVGKIGISDAILLKPGRLDPEERREMERHAEYGFRILDGSNSDLIRLAAEMALSHHERFDGKGYPRRLAAEAIPLSGRIAAVADVCDALASERPYKPAWSLDRIKAYLIENAGTQFDPQCVRALVARWSDVVALYGAEPRPLTAVA
ncbi:MAG TPA: HD domain-containing phosphohydrolase [Beijerinckiaceae bacterium]|jgi:putative two-component system response regulator